jgi:hypothetical protein
MTPHDSSNGHESSKRSKGGSTLDACIKLPNTISSVGNAPDGARIDEISGTAGRSGASSRKSAQSKARKRPTKPTSAGFTSQDMHDVAPAEIVGRGRTRAAARAAGISLRD